MPDGPLAEAKAVEAPDGGRNVEVGASLWICSARVGEDARRGTGRRFAGGSAAGGLRSTATVGLVKCWHASWSTCRGGARAGALRCRDRERGRPGSK